jgi:hypothetical protein
MAQRALLVGINKYQMAGADLQGCVNDATNVRDVLIKFFGFKVKEIRVVADERATKKGILERLGWLVKGAKAGDRLLFHYSGHGSQIRDRSGDELKDQLDEIICPHDMDWDGNYIVDDELNKIFKGLPKGVNLEVLLDSCHSGTGTRDALGREKLPAEMATRPRFLAPPADIQCRAEEDLVVRHLMRAAGNNPMNHVLFSGCKDNQTSEDAFLGGRYNGAFSYFFCRHLRDVKGKVTRAELLRRVRASLAHEGFAQVPQLECQTAKKKVNLLE